MEMSSGAAYPAGANPYYAMPPQCGYPMQPPPAVPPSSSSDGAPQGSVPYGAELPSMPAGEGGGDSGSSDCAVAAARHCRQHSQQ